MKKVIIAVVIVGAVVAGVIWLRKQKMSLTFLQEKIEVVKRGDLMIPIKASGKIQPKSKREIKSKASGEVIKVNDEAGAPVRRGDVLVELLKEDEQRNLDAAEAARDQAQIALDTAEITLEDRKTFTLESAEAARDAAAATLQRVEAEYKNKAELRKKSPEMLGAIEWDVIESQYKDSRARLRSADVDLRKAKSVGIRAAEKDVERARSALITAKKKYEEADQRLRETTVKAPIDGMVLRVRVHVGEMIQSGTQSLTGGTLLMEIADVSEIYMFASVDEADIGKVREMAPPEARPGAHRQNTTQPTSQPLVTQDTIKEDTPVEITVEAFPDDRFEGVIELISPESEVAAAVATFEVRIRITSPNRDKLRGLAGIQSEAKFTSIPVKNALLVPYEAVQRGPSGEQGVYVPVVNPTTGEKEPEFRPCKFGADNGVDVVVLSGVTEGQKVYTKLPVQTEAEKKAKGGEGE